MSSKSEFVFILVFLHLVFDYANATSIFDADGLKHALRKLEQEGEELIPGSNENDNQHERFREEDEETNRESRFPGGSPPSAPFAAPSSSTPPATAPINNRIPPSTPVKYDQNSGFRTPSTPQFITTVPGDNNQSPPPRFITTPTGSSTPPPQPQIINTPPVATLPSAPTNFNPGPSTPPLQPQLINTPPGFNILSPQPELINGSPGGLPSTPNFQSSNTGVPTDNLQYGINEGEDVNDQRVFETVSTSDSTGNRIPDNDMDLDPSTRNLLQQADQSDISQEIDEDKPEFTTVNQDPGLLHKVYNDIVDEVKHLTTSDKPQGINEGQGVQNTGFVQTLKEDLFGGETVITNAIGESIKTQASTFLLDPEQKELHIVQKIKAEGNAAIADRVLATDIREAGEAAGGAAGIALNHLVQEISEFIKKRDPIKITNPDIHVFGKEWHDSGVEISGFGTFFLKKFEVVDPNADDIYWIRFDTEMPLLEIHSEYRHGEEKGDFRMSLTKNELSFKCAYSRVSLQRREYVQNCLVLNHVGVPQMKITGPLKDYMFVRAINFLFREAQSAPISLTGMGNIIINSIFGPS